MARTDIGKLSFILLFAPFALWIALLIILPQLGIGYISLREKVGPGEYTFGFANYIAFLSEPIYWNTLLRTAWMSILVTAMALAVGFPVAYYIAKIAQRRSRAALFLMCLIPLWVSDLVRAFAASAFDQHAFRAPSAVAQPPRAFRAGRRGGGGAVGERRRRAPRGAPNQWHRSNGGRGRALRRARGAKPRQRRRRR